MRPIYGAAVVFAATLAATVGTPGPAEAFFFLPMLMQQQSQPSVNARPDRSPGDNNRWRRNGGDSAKDEATQPAKPSTSTRAKRDEDAHVGTTLGDTYDEKLGEVFQARVDALLKQSN